MFTRYLSQRSVTPLGVHEALGHARRFCIVRRVTLNFPPSINPDIFSDNLLLIVKVSYSA